MYINLSSYHLFISCIFPFLELIHPNYFIAYTGNWISVVMSENIRCNKSYSSIIHHLKGIISVSEFLVHIPFSVYTFRVVSIWLATAPTAWGAKRAPWDQEYLAGSTT